METKTQQTIVIKYGGHAFEIPELREAFFFDLKELAQQGFNFVIVHGGGPKINELLKKLNIKSQFVNGLRVTDIDTLEVVELALCGAVNKAVVRLLYATGLMPVGISGEDGGLLTAIQKNAELGFVGEITKVNPHIIHCLLVDRFLPVIAPLALAQNGDILNVNADTAAGAIAGAMHADCFVLVSDVPGVMDAEGRHFSYLTASAVEDMRNKGIINGGMIPKVESCLKARMLGCKKAMILDGRQPNSLANFLLKISMPGTEINL